MAKEANLKFRYLPEDLDKEERKALLYHAKRFMRFNWSNDLSLDWFINAGYFGVIDARKRREPGNKGWSSYVSLKVMGAIKDALREWDHSSRIMRERGEAPVITSLSAFDSKNENGNHGDNGAVPELPSFVPNVESRDLINRLCKGMSRREEFAFKLYFVEGLTMKEIGIACDISDSRIRQILAALLDRLKSNPLVQQMKG